MSLPRSRLSAVRRSRAVALAVAIAFAVAGAVPAAHAADAPATVSAAQGARATLNARMLTLHITVWRVGPTTRESVDQ